MARHPLLLLHGALGASTQFQSLLPLIADKLEVHTLNFEGHHTRPLRDRPLLFSYLAENVLEFMACRNLDKLHFFGHSLGGAIALYLARFFSERVASVFTLGTKLEWSFEIAQKENALLDPCKMEQKVPAFADLLKRRHTATGWIPLLEKVRELHLTLGTDNPLKDADLRAIVNKVRIGVGDRDKMVDLEQSMHAYRLLQHGEFQVFPLTPHPLEKIDLHRLAAAIVDFFDGDD